MINTYPPSPELVSTDLAAKIWGCSPRYLLNVMAVYGIEPVKEYYQTEKKHGTKYLWNPAAVLQVRAAHVLKKEVRQRPPQTMETKMVRKLSKAETDRQKMLAKIAARHGITVEKLRIDNANGIVYR